MRFKRRLVPRYSALPAAIFFVREIRFFEIRFRGRFNFPGKVRFSISICNEHWKHWNLSLNKLFYKEWNLHFFWISVKWHFQKLYNDLSLNSYLIDFIVTNGTNKFENKKISIIKEKLISKNLWKWYGR